MQFTPAVCGRWGAVHELRPCFGATVLLRTFVLLLLRVCAAIRVHGIPGNPWILCLRRLTRVSGPSSRFVGRSVGRSVSRARSGAGFSPPFLCASTAPRFVNYGDNAAGGAAKNGRETRDTNTRDEAAVSLALLRGESRPAVISSHSRNDVLTRCFFGLAVISSHTRNDESTRFLLLVLPSSRRTVATTS